MNSHEDGITARRFLVLHGWENHRPVEHWEWWLTDQLRSRGEQVLHPQLPSPDHPRLDDWLEVLTGFVAPVDSAAVRASSRSTVRLRCSDQDPYSTEGTAAEVYGGPLGPHSEVTPGAGHFTVDDGFGPFPDALAWCLGPERPPGHRDAGSEMFSGPGPRGAATG